MPSLMRPSSADVTSARHSSRPWRISLKSSVPVPTTAPTVAVRDEITPLSGASTRVCRPLSCCAPNTACAASALALAVFSSVRYWLICWVLSAPELCSVRARSALAAASAALACASTRFARACATSACVLSVENVASTCPAFTTSPTLAITCVRRKPLDSDPMMASCHAVMLPLAASRMGRLPGCGFSSVTVRAGLLLGTASFLRSAAVEGPDNVKK